MTADAALRACADRLVAGARQRGATHLTATEGFALLSAAGIRCPRQLRAADPEALASLDLDLPGGRVVLKAEAPGLLHRTEAGAVAIVGATRDEVLEAATVMAARVPGVTAFTLDEYVDHERGPGGELMAAARWTREFGPVVTVGVGGIDAEAITRALEPSSALAAFHPEIWDPARAASRLSGLFGAALVTRPRRGRPPQLGVDRLLVLVERLFSLIQAAAPAGIVECEVNPFAVTEGGLVALDVLATIGEAVEGRPPRCGSALDRLLRPDTLAIVGVSASGLNAGRTILRNTLAAGLPAERITIVRPGMESLDGCPCVSTVGDLEDVDVLVLAVNAEQLPLLVAEAARGPHARAIIAIPGGAGERPGTAPIARAVRATLDAVPEPERPVLIGPNCLGVRSRPGRLDTLFIPRDRLPACGPETPLAIVSQSGALAVALMSRLGRLQPRTVITCGNQLDVTLADALDAVARDPAIRVAALYAEGFANVDGARCLATVRRLADAGRRTIVYRAGRTPAGATALLSHTASLAGDAVITTELLASAGAIVAPTLDAFEDLVRAALAVIGRKPSGTRIAVVSNAGFECVGAADHLAGATLAKLDVPTIARLERLFSSGPTAGLVSVANPLDVTPMAGDDAFVSAVRALLDAPETDALVVSCVPLTPALATLPSNGHPPRLAAMLTAALENCGKPVVCAVDAGELYAPFVSALEAGGLTVFPTMDRAVRALGQVLG